MKSDFSVLPMDTSSGLWERFLPPMNGEKVVVNLMKRNSLQNFITSKTKNKFTFEQTSIRFKSRKRSRKIDEKVHQDKGQSRQIILKLIHTHKIRR